MASNAKPYLLSALRAPAIAILAAAIVSISTLHASAAPLVVGDDILATPVAGASGAIVAGPLFQAFSAATFSGELTSTVFQESLVDNPLGGLTFFYQLTNDAKSPNAILRFTNSSFAGFQTDVGFVPTDGLVPPTSQDRTTDDVIGFSFVGAPVGEGTVAPGSTTTSLIIRTDAPDFVSTTAALLDGSPGAAASYGPKPIPEPSTLALAGIGVLALLGFAARQRSAL